MCDDHARADDTYNNGRKVRDSTKDDHANADRPHHLQERPIVITDCEPPAEQDQRHFQKNDPEAARN